MRITYVISSLSAGGAERVIANLANHFSDDGDDVSVVLFNDKRHYALSEKIRVDVISDNHSGLAYIFSASLKLRRLMQELRPDVVVSFLTEINILTILASLGKTWKIIVSERNNPFVIPKKKVYRMTRKAVYPFADAFAFQTHQAQAYFDNTIQKKSRIIHNPVTPSFCSAFYQKSEVFHIVSVGRLEPQKNMHLLVSSFSELLKKYNDCRLTIFGEGSLRRELEQQVMVLGLSDCVALPGNKQNIPELISDMSAFVLPSNYEGMSNALMEAMSVGLPCISTDCPIGGASELITDHENGILVPVDDQTAMVKALIELHDDIELRSKIGMNARKINETHSISAIANEWKALMNQCRGI